MAKKLSYKDVPPGAAKDITKPWIKQELKPCKDTGVAAFVKDPDGRPTFKTVEKPKGLR